LWILLDSQYIQNHEFWKNQSYLVLENWEIELRISEMLLPMEVKVLEWIYSAMNSKFMMLPLSWKMKRISLKSSPKSGLWNKLICFLILIRFIICVRELSNLIKSRSINVSILYTIFVIRYAGQFILRLNIWIFKNGFTKLINHTLDINSTWGEQFIQE